MYKYFVAYSCPDGMGNMSTERDTPLKSIDDVMALGKEIEELVGQESVVVINFQLF